MRRIILGFGVLVFLAAGCGGSAKPVVGASPAKATIATTTSTMPDSYVCIQGAESPIPWGKEAMKEPMCPSPSTATIPPPTVDVEACAKTKTDSVDTAIVAYRALRDDADAQPSLQELVDADVLLELPEQVTLSWDTGKALSASC